MKKLKNFHEKIEKCIYIFGRNPKSSYLTTETLMIQKLAYVLASFCEGEWLSYLFSVLRKIRYNLGEKIGKFSNFPFTISICPERKNFDVTFSLERSLQNPVTLYQTMNPVFGLGNEI